MKWFLNNITLETPNKEKPKEGKEDLRYYKTPDGDILTSAEELVSCLMGRGLDGKPFFQPKNLKESMTAKTTIDKLWQAKVTKNHQIELEDDEYKIVEKTYKNPAFLQSRNPYISGQIAKVLEEAERKPDNPEAKPEEKKG